MPLIGLYRTPSDTNGCGRQNLRKVCVSLQQEGGSRSFSARYRSPSRLAAARADGGYWRPTTDETFYILRYAFCGIIFILYICNVIQQIGYG